MLPSMDLSEVQSIVDDADVVGTCVISCAEVSAALARAVRSKVINRSAATEALSAFVADWASIVRVQLSEPLCSRASRLAWERGLRGYDAVHLATALFWSEQLEATVTVATFDRELWKASRDCGLISWPEKL